MEKELNYLSEKIEVIDGQIYTLERNKNNYTTPHEIVFYISKFHVLNNEKTLLENILNTITINELT